MVFHGLQKMTLLDFPGRVAATLFTGGCNFRCPYCHNSLLVTDLKNTPVYSEEQVLAFLGTRRGILDGIALTGGEPLMQIGVASFLKKVRALGFLVKLDTNGSYPDTLEGLIGEGLVDYVAMDIKNSREKYALTVGKPDLDLAPIERSVALLKEGRVDYEFRTTVVQEYHTPEDIRAIGEWIAGARRWFLQKFVDSGNTIEKGLSAHSDKTMEDMIKIGAESVPEIATRGI